MVLSRGGFCSGDRFHPSGSTLTCRAGGSSVEHEHEEGEYPRISAERVERLETLIRLRKLYRNLLRADQLLAQPSPVYQRSGALCRTLVVHLHSRRRPGCVLSLKCRC